jgi:signal transduction histidine kinase/DNA-binding NarL/FixJ family response regulator
MSNSYDSTGFEPSTFLPASDHPCRILVIDDDPVARKFYQSLLKASGCEVAVAASGEEGLVLIDDGWFDLLIVDIRLNGMGGIEVLKAAKEKDPELQVIMITAAASIESLLQTIQFGGFDYLIKTDSQMPEVFLHRVHKALQKRKLIKDNKRLIERLTRKDRELEEKINKIQNMLTFINAVNSSWNMEELVDRIGNQLCGVLGVGLFSIFLYDRQTQTLKLFSSTHAGENLSIKPGSRREGLMDEVFATRKAIVVKDFSRSRYSRDPANRCLDRYLSPSVISIPLFSGRRMIGILNVNDKVDKQKEFTEEDVYFASILGENLAAAIHNHLLLDELKQKIGELNAAILQQKETQEQLLQTEKLAAMSTLVAGVAHEIKNPLNTMVLTAQNLSDVLRLNTCPPPDVTECSLADENNRVLVLCQKYTDILSVEIGRLKKLVEDFLDFTRPAKVEFEQVNVKTTILEVLGRLEMELGKSRVTVVKKLGHRMSPILGDHHSLFRILLNLFLNAVQAMPDGGTLTVTAGEIEGSVTITIRDTGIGIPQSKIPKVFDPFFTTKPDGVGLGLSLVYRTVEAMGGEIKLQSDMGKGTEVELKLPGA